MTTNDNPVLPSSFVPMPIYSSAYVTDFWSNWYALPVDMRDAAARSQFPKCVSDEMACLGYRGTTDGIPDLISLSQGLVGIARKMLVYRTDRAGALLYFKFMEERCYVSLRVAYFQPFSLLKLLRFAFVVLILTFLFMVVSSVEVTPVTYWNGETEYVLDQSPFHFIDGMIGSAVISIFLFTGWGLWSWWWTGRFLNFLRENFDELYRDDLASIGHAAYNAIVDSADALSLKALTPQEQPTSPPAFGLGQVTNPTRRQRRI